MIDKYEWDKLFRQRIIALCFQSKWYARFGQSIVKPEYFDEDAERNLVTFILDFYQAYTRPPTEDEVAAEFWEFPDVIALMDDVIPKLDEDLSYAETRALQFAKEQAMKLAILDSIDDIERGRFSDITARVEAALAVGQDMTEMGLDLYDDVDEWADFPEDAVKISTGDLLLDRCLDGGIAKGEYAILVAPTNVGKTQELVNLGAGAAGLISKANVVHVSLEMSAKEIALRYGARIADHFLRRDSSVIDYREDFYYMAGVRYFGNIKIRSWPTGSLTVAELTAYLNRLKYNNFIPDLLILDYPELMNLERVGEYRHNLSRTNQLIRGLCAPERFNMACWAAAQSNRYSMGQEIVELDTIAEDIGIARVGDIVITLSQTAEEYDANQLRMAGLKVRGAAKYWVIRCKIYPQAHAIIGVEVTTLNKLRQERKERESKQSDETKTKLKEYAAQRRKNGE